MLLEISSIAPLGTLSVFFYASGGMVYTAVNKTVAVGCEGIADHDSVQGQFVGSSPASHISW